MVHRARPGLRRRLAPDHRAQAADQLCLGAQGRGHAGPRRRPSSWSITAGQGGGAGRIWFDELTLTPKPDGRSLQPDAAGHRDVLAQPGHPASALLDGDSGHQLAPGRAPRSPDARFPPAPGIRRADRAAGSRAAAPTAYAVRISDDGRQLAHRCPAPGRARRAGLPLSPRHRIPVSPARRWSEARQRRPPGDPASSRWNGPHPATPSSPPWPRTRRGELSPLLQREAGRLDGRRRRWRGGGGAAQRGRRGGGGKPARFSVEPFVSVDGQLLTWNDVRAAALAGAGQAAHSLGRVARRSLLAHGDCLSPPAATAAPASRALPAPQPGPASAAGNASSSPCGLSRSTRPGSSWARQAASPRIDSLRWDGRRSGSTVIEP